MLAGHVGPVHEAVPVAKEVDVRAGESGAAVWAGREDAAVVQGVGCWLIVPTKNQQMLSLIRDNFLKGQLIVLIVISWAKNIT